MVEHLDVSSLKDICAVILIGARRQPERIDPEKRAKLLIYEILLDIGSGIRRHPKLLGVVRNLVVGPAHGAEGENHEPCKDG